MMHLKKHMILLNFLLLGIPLQGQYTGKVDTDYADYMKIKIYKSIILSKELQSDAKCHIVTIHPVSLTMKYTAGYMPRVYDLKEEKDTISIDNLRKEFQKKTYWVYPVEESLSDVNYGEDYIRYYQKSDSLYSPDFSRATPCDFSFDIIRIYEPFDKWINIYSSEFEGYNNAKVIIPVKYEYLNAVSVREKYLFYDIKINGEGIESVKVTETK